MFKTFALACIVSISLSTSIRAPSNQRVPSLSQTKVKEELESATKLAQVSVKEDHELSPSGGDSLNVVFSCDRMINDEEPCVCPEPECLTPEAKILRGEFAKALDNL